MNPNQPQQPPQKLIDFNEELKALCAKYQYELQAILVPTGNQFGVQVGLGATIQAFDVSPKDEGVALNPQPAAAPEVPAEPEQPAQSPGNVVPPAVASVEEEVAARDQAQAEVEAKKNEDAALPEGVDPSLNADAQPAAENPLAN